MSLNVADLEASATFYVKLGFSGLGGDPRGGFLMMKSCDTVIGVLQEHSPANTLTFDPGGRSRPTKTRANGTTSDRSKPRFRKRKANSLSDAKLRVRVRCTSAARP